MKLIAILIILVMISTVLVSAKTIEIKVGETWTGEYRRVALTNLNKESAVICINDEKFIIKENIRRNLNNVIVELKNISSLTDTALIYLKEDCANCHRDESFFNKNCFTKTNEIIENKVVNDLKAEPVNDIKTNYVFVILLILIAVILILMLIYFLFRFW